MGISFREAVRKTKVDALRAEELYKDTETFFQVAKKRLQKNKSHRISTMRNSLK